MLSSLNFGSSERPSVLKEPVKPNLPHSGERSDTAVRSMEALIVHNLGSSEGKEPLVDATAIASHIGFSDKTIIRMAKRGEIPSIRFRHGTRTYFKFRLGEVDAALISSNQSTPL